MSLVNINNVSKYYGYKKALDDVTLSIEPGKIYGLLGPNGSGKTTLIKLINDLLTADSGEVLIEGEKPGVNSKKIISFLPERTYLSMDFTVNELIKYFKDFYEDFDSEKALRLLEDLKINPKDKLKTMSKGTKEKVQLILVMSRNAKLYVLDEPIGGVDPASRDYILKTILNNYNKESSIIISTHLIADVEEILDEVIFINNGKIILNESRKNIKSKRKKTVDALFREEFKC